jgi:hypothetical protein
MRRVIVESPYAGDVEWNKRYARRCLADCLRRGEAPMASHLLYTQVLNDSAPEERAMGLRAGWEWIDVADALVVYTDQGISPGMREAIARAQARGIPIEPRSLTASRSQSLDTQQHPPANPGPGPLPASGRSSAEPS